MNLCTQKGITLGPLITYLKIKRKEDEEPTMYAKMTNRLIDHTMSALESVIGHSGDNFIRAK